MNRLGTRMSTGSGGWRTKSRSSTIVDSDEEDAHSTESKSNGKLLEPGENEHVVVTPPGDVEKAQSHAVSMRSWAGAPSPPPARSHVEKGKERATEPTLHAPAEASNHEPPAKAGKHERTRSRASSWASGAAGHTLRHERNEAAPEPLAGDARRSVDNVSVRTEDEELAMPGSFYGSLGSRENRRRSGSQRSHRSHHSHHFHHPDGLLAGILRRMNLS